MRLHGECPDPVQTVTGSVRGNDPGQFGEWRNGALTVQAIRVNDDGTPISGRGWAQPNPQGLVGRLFIHDGDETGFAARRLPTK